MANRVAIGPTRGSIRQRGRSFQVRVYAGEDPLTGKPNLQGGWRSRSPAAIRRR